MSNTPIDDDIFEGEPDDLPRSKNNVQDDGLDDVAQDDELEDD